MSNPDWSRSWARRLAERDIAWWQPVLLAAIGLIKILMYLTGVTPDGGMLGFGVAVLVLGWYLFTVRGFQQLVRESRMPQDR
jgi:hypothetical protein